LSGELAYAGADKLINKGVLLKVVSTYFCKARRTDSMNKRAGECPELAFKISSSRRRK
jgi:hypothetical protein